MQRISVYIPDDMRKQIQFLAKTKSKPESEVIRDALDEGLDVLHPKTSSGQALLDLAAMAKKIPTKGKVPVDAVKNMDYYTWGGEKRD